MLEFIRTIQSRRNQDGASAVEYGLLVAAIAALIVVVIFALGGIVQSTFDKTCEGMDGVSGGTSCATA